MSERHIAQNAKTQMSRKVFEDKQAQHIHHMPDAVQMRFTMAPGRFSSLALGSSCVVGGEWRKRYVGKQHYLKLKCGLLGQGLLHFYLPSFHESTQTALLLQNILWQRRYKVISALSGGIAVAFNLGSASLPNERDLSAIWNPNWI